MRLSERENTQVQQDHQPTDVPIKMANASHLGPSEGAGLAQFRNVLISPRSGIPCSRHVRKLRRLMQKPHRLCDPSHCELKDTYLKRSPVGRATFAPGSACTHGQRRLVASCGRVGRCCGPLIDVLVIGRSRGPVRSWVHRWPCSWSDGSLPHGVSASS